MIGSVRDEIILEAPEAQAEEAACMPQEIIVITSLQLPHRQSMLSLAQPVGPFDCQEQSVLLISDGLAHALVKASKPEGLFIK